MGTQTLKDKIKRDTEKISKHIRQSSQELLNEKDKTQLLQQLAVIQMEITELLGSHSSFSDGYIGEGGSGNRDTSEEEEHKKEDDEKIKGETMKQEFENLTTKLQAIMDLCNPDLKNLELPDLLNDSLEKIKKLETLLNSSNNEKYYLEQKNCQLEEELDHQLKDNKQTREQLSVYVDKLRQMLNGSKIKNDELNDRIFVLEDAVEQSSAVHKYDQHLLEKYATEIEQIEDQKVQVQKKCDQIQRQLQSLKQEHIKEISELKNKIESQMRDNEMLMKNLAILKEDKGRLLEEITNGQSAINSETKSINQSLSNKRSSIR